MIGRAATLIRAVYLEKLDTWNTCLQQRTEAIEAAFTCLGVVEPKDTRMPGGCCAPAAGLLNCAHAWIQRSPDVGSRM